MFGVIVRVYFSKRDNYIEFKVRDTTPDAINLAWNDAQYNEHGVFNETDQHGNRVTIHSDKVDMFVVMPWNGV